MMLILVAANARLIVENLLKCARPHPPPVLCTSPLSKQSERDTALPGWHLELAKGFVSQLLQLPSAVRKDDVWVDKMDMAVHPVMSGS